MEERERGEKTANRVVPSETPLTSLLGVSDSLFQGGEILSTGCVRFAHVHHKRKRIVECGVQLLIVVVRHYTANAFVI